MASFEEPCNVESQPKILGQDPLEPPWRYCSAQEGSQRECLHDVHVLEATSATRHLGPNKRRMDPARAVRRFVRPGSGFSSSTAVPTQVPKVPPRDISLLDETVRYLRGLLGSQFVLGQDALGSCSSSISSSSTHSAGPAVVYTFVMDRLAAVRQDLGSMAATLREVWGGTTVTEADAGMRVLRVYCNISCIYVEAEAAVAAAAVYKDEGGPFDGWDPHLHEQQIGACIASGLSVFPLCAEGGPPASAVGAMPLLQALQLLSSSLLIRAQVSRGAALLDSCCASGDPADKDKPLALLQDLPVRLPRGSVPVHVAVAAAPAAGAGSDDTYVPPVARATAQTRAAWERLLGIVSHVRRNHPASALRLLLSDAPPDADTGTDKEEAEVDEGMCTAISDAGSESLLLHLLALSGVLLRKIVPLLRLWRLLQCDAAGNKGEKLQATELQQRLRMCTHIGAAEAGEDERHGLNAVRAACREMLWPEEEDCFAVRTRVVTVAEAKRALGALVHV